MQVHCVVPRTVNTDITPTVTEQTGVPAPCGLFMWVLNWELKVWATLVLWLCMYALSSSTIGRPLCVCTSVMEIQLLQFQIPIGRYLIKGVRGGRTVHAVAAAAYEVLQTPIAKYRSSTERVDSYDTILVQ